MLLRLATEIFTTVDTCDQLAMLLNAHLPYLLPLDEWACFRIDGAREGPARGDGEG